MPPEIPGPASRHRVPVRAAPCPRRLRYQRFRQRRTGGHCGTEELVLARGGGDVRPPRRAPRGPGRVLVCHATELTLAVIGAAVLFLPLFVFLPKLIRQMMGDRHGDRHRCIREERASPESILDALPGARRPCAGTDRWTRQRRRACSGRWPGCKNKEGKFLISFFLIDHALPKLSNNK